MVCSLFWLVENEGISHGYYQRIKKIFPIILEELEGFWVFFITHQNPENVFKRRLVEKAEWLVLEGRACGGRCPQVGFAIQIETRISLIFTDSVCA